MCVLFFFLWLKLFCFIEYAYFIYTNNEGVGKFRSYSGQLLTCYINIMYIVWVKITHMLVCTKCVGEQKNRNVVSNLWKCENIF